MDSKRIKSRLPKLKPKQDSKLGASPRTDPFQYIDQFSSKPAQLKPLRHSRPSARSKASLKPLQTARVPRHGKSGQCGKLLTHSRTSKKFAAFSQGRHSVCAELLTQSTALINTERPLLQSKHFEDWSQLRCGSPYEFVVSPSKEVSFGLVTPPGHNLFK